MGRTACIEPQCLYKGVLYLLLVRILGQNNPVQVPHKPILVILKFSSLPNSATNGAKMTNVNGQVMTHSSYIKISRNLIFTTAPPKNSIACRHKR